jgi:predicted nucleotidyltransferase component of viral defense system
MNKMPSEKEIKDLLDLNKKLNRVKSQIKRAKLYAFKLSLDNDNDNNPYYNEINELQLQEIHILQEIQQIKHEIQAQFDPYSFSPLTFPGGF